MNEASLTSSARVHLQRGCLNAVIRKLNDRSTEGLPDTVLTWQYNTTWMEFKHLEPLEWLHSKTDTGKGLKKLQHTELMKIERVNPGHAWVVCYRSKRGTQKRLDIYRPSALILFEKDGRTPKYLMPVAAHLSTYDSILVDLQAYGVASFAGHDHGALLALIHRTHAIY